MVAAGSKGIGFAVAQELIAEGARVSLCSRSQETVNAAVDALGPRAKGYACDVSRVEDIDSWFNRTLEDLGKPSILVTNTGGPPAGPVGQMTDTQWTEGFESTLMNVVRMVRRATPLMESDGWGRIVHITSLVAKEPSRLLPISSTLRSGLMSLTRLQASELAPSGVTVNAVLPGHTMTDRQRHLIEIIASRDGITLDEAQARQAQTNPMGRIGEASEIAAAVAFLCSTRASFITGVSLLVDGGATKGMG